MGWWIKKAYCAVMEPSSLQKSNSLFVPMYVLLVGSAGRKIVFTLVVAMETCLS